MLYDFLIDDYIDFKIYEEYARYFKETGQSKNDNVIVHINTSMKTVSNNLIKDIDDNIESYETVLEETHKQKQFIFSDIRRTKTYLRQNLHKNKRSVYERYERQLLNLGNPHEDKKCWGKIIKLTEAYLDKIAAESLFCFEVDLFSPILLGEAIKILKSREGVSNPSTTKMLFMLKDAIESRNLEEFYDVFIPEHPIEFFDYRLGEINYLIEKEDMLRRR